MKEGQRVGVTVTRDLSDTVGECLRGPGSFGEILVKCNRQDVGVACGQTDLSSNLALLTWNLITLKKRL